MKKLSIIVFVIFTTSIGCSQNGKSQEDQNSELSSIPNLVFILADQWRAEATGYAGNPDVITPNLDKLAAESLIFDNAITVMAVCAPWRTSFLTVQYPLTQGVFLQ